DKAPIWKSLKALPGRIEALEARVAELEGRPAKAEHLHKCAQCGAPAAVTKIANHPIFGDVGVKQRTITCEAGHAFEYEWDPSND
ncbi:hypothetical protein, partial [Terasakiella pusilla]|uniref:hypothetical protein n=1 Tax=Terasakiella pusilla TaxID=64973 RepID=UPI003AA93496